MAGRPPTAARDTRDTPGPNVALAEARPWHACPGACKPLPLQQSDDNRTPGPPLADYASVAHVARVYDCLLGGKDNFAADRETAEQAMLINPSVVPTARANRAFLARAIRHLTGEAGLRQFLDIGTGMPASSNIHEVAQSVAPQARVVYVDHDHCKSGCAHTR
jgi:S-adenosyl methyltransferase